MAREKIALLGGSFNPVHHGHVSLADNVARTGLVDEVWLSLSPRNPFKDSSILMPAAERMQLLEKAIEGYERLKATDIELSLPEPSYTIDALDALADAYPDREFTLLIGADNLSGLTRWKNWRQLLERYGAIVYPRGTISIELPPELAGYSSRITILDRMPLYNISSTQIRNQNKTGGTAEK